MFPLISSDLISYERQRVFFSGFIWFHHHIRHCLRRLGLHSSTQRGHSSYCAHAHARAPIGANTDADALTLLVCSLSFALPPSPCLHACNLRDDTAFVAAARKGTVSCCRPKECPCIREGAGEREGEYTLFARRHKAGDDQRLKAPAHDQVRAQVNS